MEQITLGDLLVAVKGELLGTYSNLDTLIAHVETDSRKGKDLDVFFALIGENHDAHKFVPEVTSTAGFVVSQDFPQYQEDKFYVKVKDTTKALGDLAKWYRNRFHIPFIAVTGSVGKTTAKDMIASVLGAKYQVHKTQGNFNNTIGLPLTVLQLQATDQVCVLEMGMDTLGEIDYMAEIVKPDYAVITNIGDAHMQRLGSRENIRKAKFELLPHIASSGTLLLNGDDPMLYDTVQGFPFTINYVGTEENTLKHCDYHSKEYTNSSLGDVSCTVTTPYRSCKVKIPALGEHMQYPLLFALALGEQLQLTEAELLAGVEKFVPSKMRMNVVELPNHITILDDCYNANPQSMKAAIDVLASFTDKKTIAVLGDMLELGDISQDAHRELGIYLAKQGIDHVLAMGEESNEIVKAIGSLSTHNTSAAFCTSRDQLLEILWRLISPETVVLFKSSRGGAFELVANKTIQYFNNEGR